MRVIGGCQTQRESAACVEAERPQALPLCYSIHGTILRSSAPRQTITQKKDLPGHISLTSLDCVAVNGSV